MLPEFVSMSRLTFLRLETLPTLRSLLLFVLTLFPLSPSPEALGIVEFANSSRRVSKGGAFGACAPPLSLMPNEKIYGD